MKKRILVVEDEEKLRRVIELQLLSSGFEVDKVATAEEGLKLVDRADLVLTDLKLPQMDGLEFLNSIRRQNTQVPVLIMTAFGSVETAVGAMKAGATDFLLKPFSLDHLMQVINKALEFRALRAKAVKLSRQPLCAGRLDVTRRADFVERLFESFHLDLCRLCRGDLRSKLGGLLSQSLRATPLLQQLLLCVLQGLQLLRQLQALGLQPLDLVGQVLCLGCLGVRTGAHFL